MYQQGNVLVITSDADLRSLLGRSLRGAGFDITDCSTAQEAVALVSKSVPFACIVCDLELSDLEGTWVAAKIRAETGPVSCTPTLLLGDTFELDTALRGLRAGGDTYLLKPISELALVCQVGALIRMSTRAIDKAPDSFLPPSGGGAPAIRGDIEQMSLATVLMVVEMERRSGKLSVETPGHKAAFQLSEGSFARATVDGTGFSPKDALVETLRWTTGRFWFTPFDDDDFGGAPATFGSIGGLLLDATREIDEGNR